ncbi:hypothetical protein V1477_001263 [Vespula maculifrons]|uniref:Uncharacterized protein n=1 Tax=Vespula maculifrons TaxID=7453 RepID=A0ABD2CZA6_VESMC
MTSVMIFIAVLLEERQEEKSGWNERNRKVEERVTEDAVCLSSSSCLCFFLLHILHRLGSRCSSCKDQQKFRFSLQPCAMQLYMNGLRAMQS